MKFGPIEIKDKNNRTIVLRNATPDDAADLITYLKVTTAETPYLIREPEEVVMTREQETAFINNCLNSDRSLMLIATLDGKHIGNCSFNPVGNYKRYRHRCEVAIALYQEFCGYGIGKIMMETVLKAAKETVTEQSETSPLKHRQQTGTTRTPFFVCYFLTGRICSHFTMRSIKVIIKTRKSWKL
jgi:L-amino acid N-acyltransferase YncA